LEKSRRHKGGRAREFDVGGQAVNRGMVVGYGGSGRELNGGRMRMNSLRRLQALSVCRCSLQCEACWHQEPPQGEEPGQSWRSGPGEADWNLCMS
jgi:hypothetical protein